MIYENLNTFSGISITVKLAITIKVVNPIRIPEKSVVDQQNKPKDKSKRNKANAFEAL